jgi:chromosome segregation ATPase
MKLLYLVIFVCGGHSLRAMESITSDELSFSEAHISPLLARCQFFLSSEASSSLVKQIGTLLMQKKEIQEKRRNLTGQLADLEIQFKQQQQLMQAQEQEAASLNKAHVEKIAVLHELEKGTKESQQEIYQMNAQIEQIRMHAQQLGFDLTLLKQKEDGLQESLRSIKECIERVVAKSNEGDQQ